MKLNEMAEDSVVIFDTVVVDGLDIGLVVDKISVVTHTDEYVELTIRWSDGAVTRVKHHDATYEVRRNK